MPWKKVEQVCEECLHAYIGKPIQRWCSKRCAALSPEGSTRRSETMKKTISRPKSEGHDVLQPY